MSPRKVLWLAVLVASAAAAQSGPPLHPEPFPLADVHAGLRGTAWTVFQGTAPEPMDVEILGVLKNSIGPGQDMILAQLHGTKAEYTGVVAGMSGSPVYVDGKLLGALSYRIGQFSKEPIAGITPVEQMFQVRDLPGSAGPAAPPVAPASVGGATLEPIATPLVFNGFSSAALDLVSKDLRSEGLEAVSGVGGASPATKQPAPLVPGSAVSVVFARGDFSIAGTCTVTYLDAERLLACGHPITQFGGISAPMTKAEVLVTLASPLNAFKIVNTTETVGAFTQDRASAILGRFGVDAPMIPVTVEIEPASANAGPARTLHFEVLNNKQLTPQVMLASVFQSLNGTNTSGAEMSFKLSGEMDVAKHAPVIFNALATPSGQLSGALVAALYLNDRFNRVYDNVQDLPTITGIHLHAKAVPQRLVAQLESARLSEEEANPGDTVTVEATVRTYQQPPRVVRVPVHLPATLRSGPLRVLVGDDSTLDKLLFPPAAMMRAHPLGLSDTIAQLNREHTNDRMYVAILDHDTQALLPSAALPSVPPSIANTLQPLREGNDAVLSSESAVELGSVDVGADLNGAQVLILTIR